MVGFFLGDELLEGKISLTDLQTALKALQAAKTRYPWLVTWENEGGTAWMKKFQSTGIFIKISLFQTRLSNGSENIIVSIFYQYSAGLPP